ncbi:hypothetical protein BCON_0141g00020 [Botryotinia convoluta]|uniref:F-box domain-containing protein n=1 Tax=Botryotinia convoluta TaxID=54673 RepID=A0A4Z1HU19_9HELO|nr:hypothetical protein BCON_0141g00020 [Botryotinia convoluta]
MPPRFPPRVPREHINNLPPMTQDDLDAARKEFPDEKLASRALEKYESRTGYVPRKRTCHVARNTPTLAMIDQPKKKGLQKLVAHQSESEWALPRDHHRHLLNFPQEILDMISRCALTIEDHTITLDVTTSDWAQVFKSHRTYSLHDATLLRVCKSFRDNATTFLYEENVFHFTTMDWSVTGSPISWINCERARERNEHGLGSAQCPLREMPLLLTQVHNLWPFGSFEPDSFVLNDAVPLIGSSGTPILENCQFAYSHHDHFFRFLQTIGKEKAKMLKTLQFSGTMVLHKCHGSSLMHSPKSTCPKDLVDTLRLYIPIINRFCTGWEKLVIEVQKDPHADRPLLLSLGLSDSRRIVHQQYITSLLEGEVRKLKTVRTLEIYEVFGDEDAAPAAEPSVDNAEPRKLMKREKLDIAEPTIVWFRDRASKSGNDKGEE